MNDNMSEKETLNEIILAYRRTIDERYSYANLKQKYEFPLSFDEERINLLKNYFLHSLYPHPDKREELNDSFKSLDNYIKHPGKLLRLIMDSSRLLFKHGRHLGRIFNAAIKALKSFRAANNFETRLVEKALSIPLHPPYSNEDINTLLEALSRQDVERFINNNQALFEILHDRELVGKIKEIVESLIAKMKQRPNVYSPEEIRGLEIGRDIIVDGDALFEQLSEEDQQRIFDLVIEIEREVLYKIIL